MDELKQPKEVKETPITSDQPKETKEPKEVGNSSQSQPPDFSNLKAHINKTILESDSNVNTDSVIAKLIKNYYPNVPENILRKEYDKIINTIEPEYGLMRNADVEKSDIDDLTPQMKKIVLEENKKRQAEEERLAANREKSAVLEKKQKEEMGASEKRYIRDLEGNPMPIPLDFDYRSHLSVDPKTNEEYFDYKNKPLSKEEEENLYNFIKDKNHDLNSYESLFKKFGISGPLKYTGLVD